MIRHALIVLTLTTAGLAFCTSALAADEELARRAFSDGVEAFQREDYDAALLHFVQADAAYPSPGITYNIARSLEKLGRHHEAVLAYEAYISDAGESGEFTSAATVAIAQIKGQTTRLRVETSPPGAQVQVDGRVLDEKTPVSVLVSRGEHQVTIELDGWRESRAFEASGKGDSSELVFVRSKAAEPAAVTPPRDTAPPKVAPAPAIPPPRAELDGLTGSAGLSLSMYRFIGAAREDTGTERTEADSEPAGLVFGLAFDAGYALSSRTALLLRGFGGLGTSEQSLASLGAAGPVMTYRLADRWWLGGGIVFGAGRADSDATTQDLVSADRDSSITFETDVALGPSLELSFVLDDNDEGHWLVSLLPTTLVTTGGEESTLFVPLLLGYRWL